MRDALVPEFIRRMFPEVDFDDEEPSEVPEEDGIGYDPDCPWVDDPDDLLARVE